MFNISCVISLLLTIVPVPESTVRAFFQIKLFFSENVAFTPITTCTEQEQELSFRIIATSPRHAM